MVSYAGLLIQVESPRRRWHATVPKCESLSTQASLDGLESLGVRPVTDLVWSGLRIARNRVW
jgi:hypothetical protein